MPISSLSVGTLYFHIMVMQLLFGGGLGGVKSEPNSEIILTLISVFYGLISDRSR